MTDFIQDILGLITAKGYILALSPVAFYCIKWAFSEYKDELKQLPKKIFPSREEKARREKFRRFATEIERKISWIDDESEWRADKYLELEAEVRPEAGRHSSKKWWRRPWGVGLRRVNSLTVALQKSYERLVILEGLPGSGKSVALRHLAQKLAGRASQARAPKLIPIYVDLKNLRPLEGETVDRSLIYRYVLQSLEIGSDPALNSFIEQEFSSGMQNGTWFFLFDSFDEIAEILSATEADDVVKKYAKAIEDFLYGMNKCRGVLASREFKGPRIIDWARFQIAPLSEKRTIAYIRKNVADTSLQDYILEQLMTTSGEMAPLSSNPMLLGLLCDHVVQKNAFPTHLHDVYETYFKKRFERDSEILKSKYSINSDEAFSFAENIAFSLTDDAELGLTFTKATIEAALSSRDLPTASRFDGVLEALVDAKILRRERPSMATGEEARYGFWHRRFQEYFAACIVLKAPHRVTPNQLLTNARWREIAIVVCQRASDRQLEPIMLEVSSLLLEMYSCLLSRFDEGIKIAICADKEQLKIQNAYAKGQKDWWPKHNLHLLGILQAGFQPDSPRLPNGTRDLIGESLKLVDVVGLHLDKILRLQVCGAASTIYRQAFIRSALKTQSALLHDAAYKQIVTLGPQAQSFELFMRERLLESSFNIRLFSRWHSARAHVLRMQAAERLLAVIVLLEYFHSWHRLILFGFQFASVVITLFHVGPLHLSKDWGLVAVLLLSLFFALTIRSVVQFQSLISISFVFFTIFGVISIVTHAKWSSYSLVETAILCCAAYGWLWALCLNAVVLAEASVQRFWWPFLPFWIFVRKVLRLTQSLKIEIVIAVVKRSLIVVFVLAFGWWLLRVSSQVASEAFKRFLPVLRILLVLLTLFLAVHIWRYVGRSLLEEYWSRRYLRKEIKAIESTAQPISFSKFYEIFKKLYDQRQREQFVQRIRLGGRAELSAEFEEGIQSITALIEREPLLFCIGCTRAEYKQWLEKRQQGWLIKRAASSDSVEENIRAYSRRNDGLLDELSLLLRKIRSERERLQW